MLMPWRVISKKTYNYNTKPNTWSTAASSVADGDGVLVLLRLGEVVDGVLLLFSVSRASTALISLVLSGC
jgi:hypothetical protein